MLFKKSKFIICLLLALCSCNAYANTKLEVYYYDYQDAFIQEFDKALRQVSKAHDLDLQIYGDAKQDVQTQALQLSKSFDNTGAALVNLVKTGNDLGVIQRAATYRGKLIFFNRKPSDEFFSLYDNIWYIGTNPKQAGRYQAQILNDYFNYQGSFDKNKNSKLDVVILKGQTEHDDTQQRTLSFIDLITNLGYKINPVAILDCDFNEDKAYLGVKKLFSQVDGDDIEAIICNSDAMALGALKALNQKGYNLNQEGSTFIPLLGVDGLPRAIKAIQDKKMLGTVFADQSALALVAVLIAKSTGGIYDEHLPEKIWFKYQNQQVIIPYTKYAFFTNYLYKTPAYQISRSKAKLDQNQSTNEK